MDKQPGPDRGTALRTLDGDANVVGLHGVHAPSLEAIERRRLELWVVTTVVIGAVGAAVMLSSFVSEPHVFSVLPDALLRGGIVALALAFCAYAIEKELHLRGLTRELMAERLLTQSLEGRVSELATLLSASRAMNSVLDLEEVLDIILASAVELLRAEGGSVMLVEEDEWLRAVCVHGNPEAKDARARFGEGIAGRVARSREPVLISGRTSSDQFPGKVDRARPVRSAMSVPLTHRDHLLGVLNVNAAAARAFTEHDLRALSVFAEQAAGAIANARLYKDEQDRVARLVEIDRMKSEFISAINHDLRTPLTLLLGGTALARRPGLTPTQREGFLAAIERQAQHLASMIDTLLSTADADRRDHPRDLEPVDVAAVAREVAQDFEALGQPVAVSAIGGCRAVAEEGAVRRILVNLIDNAFKHGAPPVRVTVADDAGWTVLTVADQGPGVPEEHKDRIFDRFVRLDPNRSRPGMGLGLSIVHSLVEAAGGRIDVDPTPGGGATFWVSLEAAPEVSTVVSDADRRSLR